MKKHSPEYSAASHSTRYSGISLARAVSRATGRAGSLGPMPPDAADPPVLRVHLARHPQVERPGDAPYVLPPRDAALLAWLAIEGPTPRERLGALLWPESSEAQARNSLRQRLFQMRKAVGRELAAGTPVLALADEVVHDLDGSAEVLGALNLADAPELDAWLQQQRERRRQVRHETLRAQAQALEDAGDVAAALGPAQELLRIVPLSEAAHQRVMRLHYLMGDHALALAAFDRCEQTLKHELGARPSAPTLALLATLEKAATAARPEGALPAAVLRPPLLVGREREGAAFAAAWQRGAAIVVVGEAGIGKSRFVAEHTGGARTLLRAAARGGDAAQPYSLLTRVLRAALALLGRPPAPALAQELAHLIPELGEARALKSELDRARFLAAVDALLRATAEAGAAAIVIDDAHHADRASADALQHAALADTGLAWVAAMRPEGLTQGAAGWAQALLGLPEAVRIDLAPIGEADVLRLLVSLEIPLPDLPSAAPTLAQLAGGNPFFVLEAVKAMWQRARASGAAVESAPAALAALAPGLTALLAGRLRTLSPRALEVARCAAVSGQDFGAELAACVLEVRALDLADAWAELEAAQVLRGSAFTHDLIADAVLAAIPQPVAGIVHAQVAAWLAAHGGKPARVAQHFDAAAQPARGAPFWLQAGKAAMTSLRHAEAAHAFERAALGFGVGGDRAAAFGAALEMRQASFEVDLGAVSSTALELLDRFASTPVEAASARNERAVTALHRGEMPATEAAAREGLRLLGGADAPLVRAELRRNLAAVCLWRNDTRGALSEMRAVEHDIERLGTLAQRAMFQSSLAIVLDHADETDASLDAAGSAVARFLELGDVPSAVQTLLNAAVTHHDCGDLRSALAALERARALQLSLPERFRTYTSLDINFGFVLMGLGEYGQALVHQDRAVETARVQTPGWLPLVVSHRAQTWLHLGQVARALQDLNAVEPDEKSPAMARTRWTIVWTHAQAMQAAQRASRPAVDALATLAAKVPEQGRRLSRWRPQVAQLAHLAALDADAALGLAETLRAEIAPSGRKGLLIVALAHAAALRQARGDAGAAHAHALAALELMREAWPDHVYRGEVWRRCLPALRERDRARHDEELARATAWIADTAATRVPPEYRDSFVERNPANVALRAMRYAG
jgi:DNA-binding SARP family transcriptional activator